MFFVSEVKITKMKIMNYFKNHWKKVLSISFVFIVFLGRFEYKMPKRNFADFHVNYYTGQKMLKGENVYDDNAYRKDGMANFKYPPLFASITALFALTTERTAATIWFIFNFLLIILFIYYSGKMIFGEDLSYRQKNWIYFWSLFLTSRFYMHNFDEGQVNFLMMTSLFLGLYASCKHKDFLGGLLIGFSILVKYMTVILVPYFLLKRKFKLVFYIILSLILYWFLPSLFWGWHRNIFLQSQYLPFVSKTSLDINSLSDYPNQSLMSMVIRFFSTGLYYSLNIINLNSYYLGLITGAVIALFFILSIFVSQHRKTNGNVFPFNNIDIGLLSICIALFNPNAWMHAFIFLTYGYMVAIYYLFKIKFSDSLVLSLIILSFVLHSFTASFFTSGSFGNLFEIYSFVTLGAISLFITLVKIKFSPKLILK